MEQRHAVSGHWAGPWDDGALGAWAAELRGRLAAPRVTLGLVFIAPALAEKAEAILEILRFHGRIPLLAGCSGAGLIAGDREWEEGVGLVLGLYHWPGAEVRAYHFGQSQVESAEEGAAWSEQLGIGPESIRGWLVFLDPYHLDSETWLEQWNESFPGRAVVGGLASGDPRQARTQVYLDGEVREEGGIAVGLGGGIGLECAISQGCTPIGETWTITKAERNLIHQIANRRAYEVLVETFNGLSPEDREKTRGQVFLGLAMDEYQEEFSRGDFLIRNVLGADPKSGVVAVGAWPRQGQTLQFQRRDAEAATEDLEAVLARAGERLEGAELWGGCLCSCSGRGSGLFRKPNHDALLIQTRLGVPGLVGFFGNGEVGPVGGRNYLHGYTASLALIDGRGTGA
ncbi:MAG TPA: FIST N-terminal domain-containing protein [Candidatus Paceibacterota bacterium]|nr:FIST N-terminal domain-containing protein [Verrucomicrobiota bacterium]HRZ45750.1 FIST N-terminal domain-containing protein [Candidatus Paceibacterota bacterium]